MMVNTSKEPFVCLFRRKLRVCGENEVCVALTGFACLPKYLLCRLSSRVMFRIGNESANQLTLKLTRRKHGFAALHFCCFSHSILNIEVLS